MPPTYKNNVYAILDRIADEIIGGIYLHKADASAIRFYADVASLKDSPIGRHPQDYDLVRIGYITEQNHIHPDWTIVLTGSTFAATQNRQDDLHTG